jgi:ATP-dependent DNA helicase RecG
VTWPLQSLKGVGPRVAERLARLGIRSVEDLLLHLPLRYQDRTRIAPLGSLQSGDESLIEVDVVMSEVVQRGRRSLLCRVEDGTGVLTLRFFHFGSALQKRLIRGVRLRCYGEVRMGPTTLEMVHPDWRLVEQADAVSVDDRLTPVYPSTEGLHQSTLRTLTEQALGLLDEDGAAAPLLDEWLPAPVLQRLGMPPVRDAIRILHRPPSEPKAADLEPDIRSAHRRLAFEELLAHQLSLRQLRAQIRRNTAPSLKCGGSLVARFLKDLPFALTAAQERVIDQIGLDMVRSRPMLRLVQGDVGSGKTVVAAVAALWAVEAGLQAALMAPTELLAEQHFQQFCRWFESLGVEVAWLCGKLKGRPREAILERTRLGQAQVAVGTHALFQEGVVFANLALVIVDEQHRFGVHQRLALREKGRAGKQCPHQLVMTATPIPRTLAMSAYADLDTSVIDELPPGRKPVKTIVLSESRRNEVIARVHLACRAGKQAYWVCTLIEESEALQCQAAADTADRLVRELPDLRIGLVHGRLKAEAKEQVMAGFKAGELDLLVATTVIEVGVDVPNASLMIIENVERLGLAQLHQLRGRVGRGSAESSCVLIYRGPLSDHARARLGILRASNDGFAIARRDLELRGPGEVLGTRQTGALQTRVADLLRDEDMIPGIQQVADELLRTYPDRVAPIVQRWIGNGGVYGEV